jgi:Fe-S-cluster containining protein
MSSQQKYKALIPVTAQERLVRDVYGRIDAAADRELARLRREAGVVSSCKRGCSSCCGQHIQTNPAEAHALGQYIKRTFSMRQIGGLRRRTRKWLAWESAQRKEDPPAGRPGGPALFRYEPCCPLLVNRACSAYPVRPVICRTHFVSSDPAACRPAHTGPSREPAPLALTSVLHATQPFAQPLRTHIEAAGMDFSRSIMLLPHWLAMEMGWESPEEE